MKRGKNWKLWKNELHFGALENVKESFVFSPRHCVPCAAYTFSHDWFILHSCVFTLNYLSTSLDVDVVVVDIASSFSTEFLPFTSGSNRIILYLFHTSSTRMRTHHTLWTNFEQETNICYHSYKCCCSRRCLYCFSFRFCAPAFFLFSVCRYLVLMCCAHWTRKTNKVMFYSPCTTSNMNFLPLPVPSVLAFRHSSSSSSLLFLSLCSSRVMYVFSFISTNVLIVSFVWLVQLPNACFLVSFNTYSTCPYCSLFISRLGDVGGGCCCLG